MKRKNHDIIESGRFYHVGNCAVGNEVLFTDDDDYKFFLDLLSEHVLPYAKLWAYCLMPDHYHLLLEINGDLKGKANKIISAAFRDLGSKFARNHNKKVGRKGTLFMRPFKKKKIKENQELEQVITYIHLNDKYHGVNVDQSSDSIYRTSFKEITDGNSKLVTVEKVVSLFKTIENFGKYHQMVLTNKLYKLVSSMEFVNF